jgi:hypothetical protein
MNIKKNYTKTEVLEAGKIGFEFEFYSSMEVIKTARDLGKFLKKRIVVPMNVSTLGEPKPLYHSPIQPSGNVFKLEPDYSGGKKMCELVTGPLPYPEARNILIKMFEWISSNGYTTERCSIHLNISIDGIKLPTRFKVENMNVLKFILSFDENFIYKDFPGRKDSVYARSIKEIYPNSIFLNDSSSPVISANNFKLPDEKYFGVNFLKKEKGYLEYRYVGGKDYEKKGKKILDILEYCILHLHDVLNFTEYTKSEENYFKELYKKTAALTKPFIKYESFKKAFPKLEVSIDLNTDDTIVQTYWNNIREKLFSLILHGGLKEGKFNYDTELSKHQLLGAKVRNCKITYMEFISCDIEGVISNSTFYKCKLQNSRITDCDAPVDNKFIFCKVSEVPLHASNYCEDCFIENKKQLINCEVKGGVIRNGEIGKLAKISKETNIVEQIEPAESPGAYKDEKQEKENKDKAKDAKKKKDE